MSITRFAFSLLACISLATALPHQSQNPSLDSLLDARTVGPIATCSSFTNLVGDGDPHQLWYETQVTDTLVCGSADGCTVAYETSTTVGFSLSVGFDLAEFFSGEFAVEESWTSGESLQCDGDQGDQVCIWASVQHTAYTVATGAVGTTCSRSSTGVVTAPNTNDNSNYYCVTGDACRTIGQGYWNGVVVAGGPP